MKRRIVSHLPSPEINGSNIVQLIIKDFEKIIAYQSFFSINECEVSKPLGNCIPFLSDSLEVGTGKPRGDISNCTTDQSSIGLLLS